jgi:2-iminobutanoate/2-iminopropanoate deaminase
MLKQAGMAPDGPKTMGPYSHYNIAGDMVYVSGQGPWDPATESINLGEIEEQTRLTMENLARILAAAGSSLDQVVRCGVYLTDMSLFPRMNAVYGTYFPNDPPVRTTIGVASLPGGIAVEIDCIAALP